MCGIGGILRIHPPGAAPPPDAAIPEEWLNLIDDAIKHRGPDGKGRFRDRVTRPDGSTVDVALVHRRLSIIDHRDGWQPMVQGGMALLSRENGPYRPTPTHVCSKCAELGGPSPAMLAVVFNGCIYNHRELRKELQAAGHIFATDHSDTEVLLHGWREWGLGSLEQDGDIPLRTGSLFSKAHDMFAVAIWDRTTGTVTLARDRFGQKPVYYSAIASERTWAFASTVPALARLPQPIAFRASVSTEKLHFWIRFGSGLHPPHRAIEAPPVSTTVTLGGSLTRPEWYEMPEFFCDYWRGPWGDTGIPRSRNLSADEVDGALRLAVAQRLEADVSVGCFLSGGVDSSLLANYAMEALGQLQTFSVRMPSPELDESELASQIAAALGTNHNALGCEGDPASDLVSLINELGLPFGDSSLLPTHWVSRATRGAVTVAISGDGGDELFAGYERYSAARLLRSAWPLLAMLPLTPDAFPKSSRSRAARLADAARHDHYCDLISIFPVSLLRKLCIGTAELGVQPLRWIGNTLLGGIEDALNTDLGGYLPDDLLRKTDTAAMSVALEVRCPFLAPAVAGPASHATVKSLMPHNQRKGLLRAVARKYFPKEIVDRPKQGFAIPIGDWFRSDYGGMKQLLLDHLESVEPWGSPTFGIDLNMKFVRRMLKEHMDRKRDHSQRLYMLLVLSIWAKGLGT